VTAFEAQGEDEAEVACMQLVNRRYRKNAQPRTPRRAMRHGPIGRSNSFDSTS
jgi:hypothetical protein